MAERESDPLVVLGGWESRLQGEGVDRNTPPSKETWAGHERPDKPCQPYCWLSDRRQSHRLRADASISEEPGAKKTARRDLCGGRRVTGVPTAMPAWRRCEIVTVVSGAASMGSKASTWELRPILWFASAYTVNIILHESAHAVAAYALGFPSTLFNFWVNPDLMRATMNERVAVGIAGPAFNLCFGTLCWLTYRRVRESAAAMPFAYLSAFGLSIFFGNLMSASFVGDFSDAAMVLDLPRTARHLASFEGALSVAAILFMVGRELRRWTPQHVGRLAAAFGIVVLPVLAGTALVVLVNQPMPMPVSFLAARAGEGAFWAFAGVGCFGQETVRPSSPTHVFSCVG
jgi:hypothetical protein